MRAIWLLAKHVEDLRRREPRNVGVLLFSDQGVQGRFVGQRDDGSIDGRTLSFGGPRLDNYKAWVAFWDDAASRHKADPRALVVPPTPDASYFLEFGGEQLLGPNDPATLLDQLFRSLVTAPKEPAKLSVKDRAEELFVELGIRGRVEVQPKVQRRHRGVLDVLRFDYRFDNGTPHFLQAVSASSEDKGWGAAHQAAYLFEKLHEVDGLQHADTVGLVRGQQAGRGPITFLRTLGTVIDLDDIGAKDRLGLALGV